MNAGFQRQRIQPRVKKSYSKNVGLEVISTTIAKCIQVCLKRLEYQPLLKNQKHCPSIMDFSFSFLLTVNKDVSIMEGVK